MRPSRSNSAAAAVRAIINAAAKELLPPKHCPLPAAVMPFWRGIINSRAPDEWTPADLAVAAQLARVQADIETESKALQGEGSVIGDRVNPRFAVVDALSKRQMGYMRTLRMGGAAAGEARHVIQRRKLDRQAKKIAEDIGGDPLLA